MPDVENAAREKSGRRPRRNALIGLTLFVAISLGVGPRLVEYYFDWGLDTVADQLGSVEIETARLATGVDLHAWAFAEPNALDATSVTSEDAEAYAAEHGVSVGLYDGQMVIQSNRAQDLIITEIRARIIRETEPLSGSLFIPQLGPVGGPERPVIRVAFMLDDTDTRAVEPCTGDSYFARTKLHLSRGESMVVHIQADGAADHYYEWVVNVELAIGADVRTVTVPDPDDEPFRLTAAAPRYDSVYAVDPDVQPDVIEVNPDAMERYEGDPRIGQRSLCASPS